MATKKTTKKTAAKKTAKKQTPKTAQTWNNVKGLMRVWATERGNKKKSWLSFSTSIGKKNEDEEYDNVYFDVLFKKNDGNYGRDQQNCGECDKGYLNEPCALALPVLFDPALRRLFLIQLLTFLAREVLFFGILFLKVIFGHFYLLSMGIH